MIQSFGLFWKIADVNFGKQSRGAKGQILGIKSNEKRGKEIDIWDFNVIYALYSNFELVYIGQAKLFGKRLRAHHLQDHLSGRFDTFSWFQISTQKENKEKPEQFLNHFEAILIYVSEPKLNLQRGKLPLTHKYLQKK